MTGGKATTHLLQADGSRRVRVVVVDDDALSRKVIARALQGDDRFAIAGEAPDALAAKKELLQTRPDVVTLDVNMPGVDGLHFLEKLMAHFPMPAVVVSASGEAGGEIAVAALALGAVSVVQKPSATREDQQRFVQELRGAVAAAAQCRIRSGSGRIVSHAGGKVRRLARGGILAIGASTGGPQALPVVLGGLVPDMPPILITQHMPVTFTDAFARRLDAAGPVRVQVAQDGVEPIPGRAYLAPGDKHLRLVGGPGSYRLSVQPGERVSSHIPSVDVLFHSVAEAAGRRALGVLLTGMGRDGADGLLAMRRAGARTIAQDEASSVVWGMPGVAVRQGAAEQVMALDAVAAQLLQMLEHKTTINLNTQAERSSP